MSEHLESAPGAAGGNAGESVERIQAGNDGAPIERVKRAYTKRKRAEPDAGSVNPAELPDPAGSDSEPRTGTRTGTRGRTARAEKEAPLSLDALVTALSIAQLSLVTATGVPEFMLSPDQTDMLAKASQKVARHFPPVLTTKQQDIVALLACVGTIAFAQARAYSARKAEEKVAKARGSVVSFGGIQNG